MNLFRRLLPGMLALLLCAGLLLPLQAKAARTPLLPGMPPPVSGAAEEAAAEETAAEPEGDVEESRAAAEKPALIAHAGGAIYGFRLTNSLEALEEAYACGHRVLEVDLSLTSDGEIVLIHDWEEMALRLYSGEIAASPLIKNQLSPCGYCDYKAACGFEEGDITRQHIDLSRGEVLGMGGEPDGSENQMD